MKRLFTAGLIWLGALGYANSQNWKQAQTGVLGTGASHQFGINIGGAWSALFTITGAGGVIPGGLAAFSCASNTWLASSSGGGAVCTQPAFSDISGVASANQIPAPTTLTIGGVKSSSAPTSQFMTGIDAAGGATYAQPAANDIANLNPVSSVSFGLKAFGDSISAGKGSTSPATLGWVARIGADYGITPTNYAVEGHTNVDMQARVFNSLTPTDSNNPVVTMMIGANDVSYIGNSYYRKAYETGLLATAAFASIQPTDRIDATSTLTVTEGTWTNDATFSSITGKKSTTNGSTYTVNFWSGSGVVYLFYGSYYSSGGTFGVTINSTPNADQISWQSAMTSQLQKTNLSWPYLTSTGVTQGVAMARYLVPANQMLTMQITVTSATGAGNPVTIYGIGMPQKRQRGLTAPRVFLAGAIRQPGDDNATATAILDAANKSVVQTLQADGLAVNFVDIRQYLNASNDMSATADQNCPAVASGYYGHPNDCGHKHIAQAFEDSINAQPIKPDVATFAFRNRLTNANFDIWQRGTSFTVPTGSLAYTADRWFAQNDSGGDATVTQASAPAGFRGLNAIRIQAPMSAGSIAGWGQRFEGQMVSDLDGKNVVVSFDLSQSVSGGATATWYLQLFGNTALDNGTFSTTLFSTTFTPPASAGVVSIAIPAASTVGLKYGAHFKVVAVRTSGSGTLDAYLGSVQFEADRLVGGNWNNPTPFEFRPLPVELTMSRRFYQRVPLQGVLGQAVASNIIFCSLKFEEEMRATPTATLLKTSVSGATYDLSVGWNFVTASGLSITNYVAQPKSASFQWSGFSGLTVGGLAAGNGLGDLVELSAEL